MQQGANFACVAWGAWGCLGEHTQGAHAAWDHAHLGEPCLGLPGTLPGLACGLPAVACGCLRLPAVVWELDFGLAWDYCTGGRKFRPRTVLERKFRRRTVLERKFGLCEYI